jgi:hypothetical protein
MVKKAITIIVIIFIGFALNILIYEKTIKLKEQEESPH